MLFLTSSKYDNVITDVSAVFEVEDHCLDSTLEETDVNKTSFPIFLLLYCFIYFVERG